MEKVDENEDWALGSGQWAQCVRTLEFASDGYQATKLGIKGLCALNHFQLIRCSGSLALNIIHLLNTSLVLLLLYFPIISIGMGFRYNVLVTFVDGLHVPSLKALREIHLGGFKAE